AFFVLPISVKWLFAAVLGATFLINVSQWDGAGLILMLTGTLWGYFYATAFRGLKTPFPFTHKADKWLAKQRERFKTFFTRKKGKEEKIVDISTGKQPLSDEEFVDRMLEKISNFGEESLTPQEKKRLDQIARNKKI
ncbi:MAG: hypothetical protein KDK48_03230, partial [Chlamydiia bacterium]|nr:hypothetical protein [Chlamydiia bacterium]